MTNEWWIKLKNTNFNKNNQNGSAILAVIVILPILFIIIQSLDTKITIAKKARKSSHLRSELTRIKAYIDTNIHCSLTDTQKKDACDTGEFIDVRSSNLKTPILIANPDDPNLTTGPTEVGSYKLRAKCKCVNCTKGTLIIEAARLNKNGSFMKNPLTGKLSSWKDTYKDIPIDCDLTP